MWLGDERIWRLEKVPESRAAGRGPVICTESFKRQVLDSRPMNRGKSIYFIDLLETIYH